MDRRGFLAGAAALGLAPLLARLPALGAIGRVGTLQVARVAVSSPAQAALLRPFDVLCGQASSQGVDVLLWPGDAARLRATGLDYEIVVADVAALDAAGGVPGSTRSAVALPGQREDYRVLADYEADLHSLAERFPDRARLLTLPERSLEGRPVYGIEIAGNVAAVDGRPCFYMDGIHHAREWPAGEMPIMFAHDLLESYETDEQVRRLVDTVRTVIVPVVNVDGFEHSRNAGIQQSSVPVEGYWRKNRRSLTNLYRPANPDAYGVDPNRNYQYLWGGEGAGFHPADQTYRGDGPFSEPDTRNVRSIAQAYPVVACITNHTSGRLILRPWGHTADDCPDEPLLESLGAAMAAFNGYTSQKGIGLYPTTGTMDDWMYAAYGTLGYTFEHLGAFHPQYATSIPGAYAANRGAYLTLMEAAANPVHHSVVTGRAVGSTGMRLRARMLVEKTTATPVTYTPQPPPIDRLAWPTRADSTGSFELHVNPSTAPVSSTPEAYTLTLSAPGYVTTSRQVVVGRGERVDVGDIVLPREQ